MVGARNADSTCGQGESVHTELTSTMPERTDIYERLLDDDPTGK